MFHLPFRNKQSETDDSASIQNQKSMLIQYALEQGWEIYNIYSVGHVLQIPLVYKTVVLAGFLISLVRCVRIVHDGDCPDTE